MKTTKKNSGLKSNNNSNRVEKYIHTNGDVEYTLNGQLHRNNGLPAFEGKDGYSEWWEYGIFIRDNEPKARTNPNKNDLGSDFFNPESHIQR